MERPADSPTSNSADIAGDVSAGHGKPNAARPKPGNKLSTAVLCVWNDIDREIENEYEPWYQWEHLPDRVDLPGFRSCRRYVRTRGEGRQYFTFSDLDAIEVLTSAGYLDRLREPPDWTRRIMPHFRRAIRLTAKVWTDRGDGTGGFMGVALFEGLDEQRRTAIRAALTGCLDEVMKDARVTRIRVLEEYAAGTGVPNPEAALRPDPPKTAELAILAEGSFETAVSDHLARITALTDLAALVPTMPPSIYRLLYSSRS